LAGAIGRTGRGVLKVPRGLASRAAIAQSSIVLTALVGAAYVGNYVFYVILSRTLPIESFGAVGGYLAILGVIALASSALIFAAAKMVAAVGTPEHAARVRSAYLPLLRKVGLVAGAAAVALSFVSLEAALIVGAAALVPLRDLHCGLLNGLKMNARFGWVVLIESVFRIGGALATLVVPDPIVALAPWFLSFILGWALARWMLPAPARARAEPVPLRRTTTNALLMRAPQVSFLNTDVILVAVLFGADKVTGLYVGAALLSRVPFYLVTPFVMGELPRLVDPQSRRVAQIRSLVLGAAGAAFLTLPLMLIPGFALEVGFGQEFGQAAGILVVLAFTGFLLVQSNTLAYILFAGGFERTTALFMAAGAIAEVVLVLLLAPEGGTLGVAWATVAASGGTLALFLARYLYRHSSKLAKAD
jgi:O-antigen/teichoic acid export membrane protein